MKNRRGYSLVQQCDNCGNIKNCNNSNAYYLQESDFIRNNCFRNNLLANLSNKLDNNTLILIDYIEHGELLLNTLKDICKTKQVYFIRGEVDIQEREKIQMLMEKRKDIIKMINSQIWVRLQF